MDRSNQSGIYCVLNTVTGKRYVGRTHKFSERFTNHRWHLNNGTHANALLQRSWKKYGAEAFEFKPLVIADPDFSVWLEQRCLDSGRYEFNLSKTSRTPVVAGEKRDPMIVAKISHAQKGPLNHRFGKRNSPEHRAKISAGNKGRVFTPEQRARFKQAAKKRAASTPPWGHPENKAAWAARLTAARAAAKAARDALKAAA